MARDDWHQRCARCEAWTGPHEREGRRCNRCGGDPRSTRQRLGTAVRTCTAVVAALLALPSMAVVYVGLWAYETLTGGE